MKGFGCRPVVAIPAGSEGRRPKPSQEGIRGPRWAVDDYRYGDLAERRLARRTDCRGPRRSEDRSSDFVAEAVVEGRFWPDRGCGVWLAKATEPAIHDLPGDTLGDAEISALQDRPERALGRDRMVADKLPVASMQQKYCDPGRSTELLTMTCPILRAPLLRLGRKAQESIDLSLRELLN